MEKKSIGPEKLLEAFAKAVARDGKLERNLNGYDSESEGTYSRGYRESGTVHRLETKDFTAEFTKATYTNWNLAADTTRREEKLTITYGKRQMTASHVLGGEIKRFGPQEMYEGTETIQPEPWKALSGKIPVELMEAYLKKHPKP